MEKDQGEINRQISGPFYCGMSVVMPIPQISIRLCSPTSTTMNIEVAGRFGGSDGMLIELSTKGHCNADLVRSFDCAWWSVSVKSYKH